MGKYFYNKIIHYQYEHYEEKSLKHIEEHINRDRLERWHNTLFSVMVTKNDKGHRTVSLVVYLLSKTNKRRR